MVAGALLPQSMATSGRETVLLLLAAFLVTFVLTRVYTRLARERGWGSGSVGGVHLHHMTIGIVLVLVGGLVEIAVRPAELGRDVVGIVFGIGAALTLDEFALWLYLRDVYWCPEGRSSIDATVMGLLLGALLLVGTSPFGIDGTSGGSRAVAFAMIAVNVVLAVLTLLKGKLTLGLLAVFIPFVGLLAAIRLAKPRSLWSRWFYGDEKVARGRVRHAPTSGLGRLHARLDDLIGGTPSFGVMPLRVVGGRLMPASE